MKVLAVNAGSSSLKFQLLEMPEEKLLCSGLVERIGLLNEGMFKVAYSDKKQVKEHIDIPTHKEAVSLLLNALLELNIISSYEDI
ncbi:MAG: acetate kinase, partial [Acholeplasmatales bacterium]|nr:acetate kinase [Acholeplasmatales bacterium]